MNQEKRKVKSISLETFVFLGVLLVGFGYIGNKMGVGIMFSVIMETAHDLLLDTVFFIMALAVLAGALSALLSEFGVITLINRLLSVFIRPLYGFQGQVLSEQLLLIYQIIQRLFHLLKIKSFKNFSNVTKFQLYVT